MPWGAEQRHYAIKGPPGTGKTSELMRRAVAYDRDLMEVRIATLTNSVADELEDRLEESGVEAEASTLHSLGYELIGRGRTVMPTPREDYGAPPGTGGLSVGADGDGGADADEQAEQPHKKTAWEEAQYDAARQFIEQHGEWGQPPAIEEDIYAGVNAFAWWFYHWTRLAEGVGVSPKFRDDLARFGEHWREWAHATGTISFPQMLEDSMDRELRQPVLMVDEVQDLSPLEWEWLRRCPAREKVLAGDDFQLLYEGIRTGGPEWMFAAYEAAEQVGDMYALEQTHRLPWNIWGLASSIEELIRAEYLRAGLPYGNLRRDWTPCGPCDACRERGMADGDGAVLPSREEDAADLALEALASGHSVMFQGAAMWFVAGSGRYEYAGYRRPLRELGLPIADYGRPNLHRGWRKHVYHAVTGARAHTRGAMTWEQYGGFLHCVEAGAYRRSLQPDCVNNAGGRLTKAAGKGEDIPCHRSRKDAPGALVCQHVAEAIGNAPLDRLIARPALNPEGLGVTVGYAIKGVERNGEAVTFPDGVRNHPIMFSTIHRAKGREADVVFTVPSVPKPAETTVDELGHRAPLMRLEYVAASRARQTNRVLPPAYKIGRRGNREEWPDMSLLREYAP